MENIVDGDYKIKRNTVILPGIEGIKHGRSTLPFSPRQT